MKKITQKELEEQKELLLKLPYVKGVRFIEKEGKVRFVKVRIKLPKGILYDIGNEYADLDKKWVVAKRKLPAEGALYFDIQNREVLYRGKNGVEDSIVFPHGNIDEDAEDWEYDEEIDDYVPPQERVIAKNEVPERFFVCNEYIENAFMQFSQGKISIYGLMMVLYDLGMSVGNYPDASTWGCEYDSAKAMSFEKAKKLQRKVNKPRKKPVKT